MSIPDYLLFYPNLNSSFGFDGTRGLHSGCGGGLDIISVMLLLIGMGALLSRKYVAGVEFGLPEARQDLVFLKLSKIWKVTTSHHLVG